MSPSTKNRRNRKDLRKMMKTQAVYGIDSRGVICRRSGRGKRIGKNYNLKYSQQLSQSEDQTFTQIQGAQAVPNKINPSRRTLRHIIKMAKPKVEIKSQRKARLGKNTTYGGIPYKTHRRSIKPYRPEKNG